MKHVQKKEKESQQPSIPALTQDKNIFTTLMSMDDKSWQRHANPYSVWSRVITGLPLLLLALWSIQLLGIWSLLTMAMTFLWLWLNPRIFPEPKNTDNWASKVTFGERIWLARKNTPIPAHHAQWAMFLAISAGLGFILAVYGACFHLLIPTLVGGVISWFGKMWFCDRMVWLFEEMKNKDPQYQHWLRK